MLSSVRLKYTVLHVVRMGTVLIGILLIVWWFREVCEGVLGMFIGNTVSILTRQLGISFYQATCMVLLHDGV